jgi:hypothetical protein
VEPKFTMAKVVEYFNGDNPVACEDCPFFSRWEERHPYGNTYATEHMSECGLLEGRVHSPFLQRFQRHEFGAKACPGINPEGTIE